MLRIKIIEAMLWPKIVKSLIKRSVTTKPGTTTKHNVNNTNNDDDYDDLTKPIKFSTSKAATWPANGIDFDIPRYPGVILSLSITIFLVYFAILREESDIDQKITNNMDPDIQQLLYGLKQQQKEAREKYYKTV